ncbi:hypothetical protein GWK47_047236 [Chionoecetes opilio]|uniref:Uncharacterized protein n=1 Tax=Chionoecetes opilio TaxID=41210 RepID=A0A8J4YC68_CHIOP|nr:hypothetical protein GWK47_047236 [Chionoecetes opilio]
MVMSCHLAPPPHCDLAALLHQVNLFHGSVASLFISPPPVPGVRSGGPHPQCPPPRLDKVDLLVAEIMGVNISSCLDLAGTQNSFDHALRDISSDGAGYSETEEATETRSEGGDFSEEEKEESLDYDARLSEAEDTTESHSDGPRLSEAEETTESRYDGAKPNEAEKTKESCSDGVRYSEAEKTNESHNDGVRFSETVKTKESHSDGFKVSEEKIREKCQSYTASEQLLPQQNPIVSAPSVKAVNINDEEDMNYMLQSQLIALNVTTFDLPTLLAAAGVHPSR